ncbi:MAG: hypothetical protein FWD17_13815 [Polyangiaceae bacterium]|nr:hypothetical protein [Polyangiaceae bacterium]
MSPSHRAATVALFAYGATFSARAALAAPSAGPDSPAPRPVAQGLPPTSEGTDPSVPAPVSTPRPTPAESTPVPEAPPLEPPPGRHDATARIGPQIGVRVGYGLGSGSVYRGLPLHTASDGAVPIIVDLGWRFIPELYAGLYGQFGPVVTRNNPASCPGDASCSSQDWRFGIEVDYHFLPRTRLDPYVGLGSGYEILHTHVTANTLVPMDAGPVPARTTVGLIDRGWEFAALTLGMDARACSSFGIGPFVSASIGEYNVHTGNMSTSVLTPAGPVLVQSTPVPGVSHGTHELYIFGVRGTFNM